MQSGRGATTLQEEAELAQLRHHLKQMELDEGLNEQQHYHHQQSTQEIWKGLKCQAQMLCTLPTGFYKEKKYE